MGSDRGFTLPETLVTVVVVALLAGAVAASFTVIARSLPPAEARADDARTLAGLTTYLPEDVGSTPPDGFVLDDPGRETGCGGVSPGLDLLHLTWSDGDRTWIADYRLESDDDASSTRVRRYSCQNGGPASVNTLTSALPAVDAATWQPGDAPVAMSAMRDELGRIVGVTVTVTTVAGTTAEMVARSNNPAEQLSAPPETTMSNTTSTSTTSSTTSSTTTTTTPPTTTTAVDDGSPTTTSTTSSTTTSTTTTTTTTTLPPCEVAASTVDPADPRNDTGKSSKTMAPLRDHVVVEATVSGVCTDLVLEFDPDLADGTYDPQWLSFDTSVTPLTVTIEAHPAGVDWSDGVHVLTLRNGIGTGGLAEIELMVR